MIISLLVAADEQNVIGLKGRMPWHLPADLRHFRELTMGHCLIMGRKTFDSIGKALPGRTNLVVSRNKGLQLEGARVMEDLKPALDYATTQGEKECFIIGGGTIYLKAMLWADKIYLTRIHDTFEGDTFFPALEESNWKETAHIRHSADEKNPYDYSFCIYERVTR